MKRILQSLAAICAICASVGAQAAPTFATDLTSPVSIGAIATFDTDGASMAGMTVTATFSDPTYNETLTWAATGALSGGVTGTDGVWGVSVSGDTFANGAWTFSLNRPTSDLFSLVSLEFDGQPGFTIFDRSFGGAAGTAGSENGKDFAFVSPADFSPLVTYSNPVQLGAALPVEDTFFKMTVDFGLSGGPVSGFKFTQDTDNDAARFVPEPTSLALVGLALAGLGLSRRRRA